MANNKRVSLNLNVRGLRKSPTLAINELSKKLKLEGKTVFPMGLGQSPFPVPDPVVETLKLHAHEKDYLNVNGLESLRESVANFHRKNDFVDIQPDHVLIGPGSKELMFLLQLVYYGELILPSPCWVSYAPQARILSRNSKYINTTFENRWKLTPGQLESFLQNERDQYRPRILLLNYPANPDGCSYSTQDLEQIAEIARKYELIILSDEIYGQLNFDGNHVSIARYYPEGTVISSGLSKWCGAGGWRLGTFAFPKDFDWLMHPMAAVASETYTSVSAPIQYAAVTAFNGDIAIERYLHHVRRILAFLAEKSTRLLRDAGIQVHMPDGAFYLFLDFSNFSEQLRKRGITNSEEMCKKLLEQAGVAILPGVAFNRPAEELTARLAFVNFDGAKALAMSESIPWQEDISDVPCFEPVFAALQRVVAWISG